MPTCVTCGNTFSIYARIDGVAKNLGSRKRCLECSPFGAHNNTHTAKKPYRCACGETDPEKFYGNKHTVCATCHCDYTRKLNREKREFIREYLGRVCKRCGFDGPTRCYDVHHPDPSQKDPEFIRIRNWSKQRILAEIIKCVLLCKNCHAIEHNEE
jgi:hypothetical protein